MLTLAILFAILAPFPALRARLYTWRMNRHTCAQLNDATRYLRAYRTTPKA